MSPGGLSLKLGEGPGLPAHRRPELAGKSDEGITGSKGDMWWPGLARSDSESCIPRSHRYDYARTYGRPDHYHHVVSGPPAHPDRSSRGGTVDKSAHPRAPEPRWPTLPLLTNKGVRAVATAPL